MNNKGQVTITVFILVILALATALVGGFMLSKYLNPISQEKIDNLNTQIASQGEDLEDIESFVPLVAQRCVMSGWKPTD